MSRSLQRRHGSTGACGGVRDTEYNSVCTSPFEGGHHNHHYPYPSVASGQTTGREQPIHQQKIGLKIYRAWPCPPKQDPASPTVSLSHQEASISLLFLSIRGQTDENHNHRKLIKLIKWITALFNSMKL